MTSVLKEKPQSVYQSTDRRGHSAGCKMMLLPMSIKRLFINKLRIKFKYIPKSIIKKRFIANTPQIR